MVDVEGIEALLNKYTYGKYHLAEEEFNILYNPETAAVLLERFFRHDTYPLEGTCSELTLTARKHLKERYPKLHTLIAEGHDRTYFTRPGSNHTFLLVSDKPPFQAAPKLMRTYLRFLYEPDPYVVDPSLNSVTRLSESGYTIKSIIPGNTKGKVPNSPLLHPAPTAAIPLAFTNDKTLISLIVSCCDHKGLGLSIGLHGQNQKPIKYTLTAPELSSYTANDERLNGLIEAFKACEPEARPGWDFDYLQFLDSVWVH